MGTEDGIRNTGNTECAEGFQCLKRKAISDGVVISNGNGVAEEPPRLKSESVNGGAVFSNGNGVADVAGVVKSELLNNGVNGNGVIEGAGFLKSEAISNGVVISDGFDSGDGDSSGFTSLRTYKRRKHDQSSSKGKAQEDCRKCAETASRIADQVVKEPFDATLGKTADDCPHRHWGNAVLKHLYQSLGNGNGGIEGCIGEALIHHTQISCATTVMGTSKIDKDGQEFSSQVDRLSHRTRTKANGHAHVMQNGSSSEPHGRGVTEMCQRVLCNMLTSEKFSSLCKTLFENFQGMKPESVFDFSVMNSRMKQKTYEQSPALFLSDIEQVWRKLQDTCNEIFALAKSLSTMSRTSYCELVGVSAQSTFEDEKQVEFGSHIKPETMEECDTYKICCCSHCGERADGTDCLVCDSCEKMYHLSCIEPAVKEIPHKSWYCANCTTDGIGSPHANCVVCMRLNDIKTSKKIIGDESLPTNEETLHEFEENSNCSYDGIQISTGGEKVPDCKVCGNEVEGGKIKVCGHRYCPSKYYHARCLTSKLLKSYGNCWYCPSCLCQVCVTDQDDDQIVLCDGCDHAYHIYCMKPPLASIPEGKWFCKKCDAGIKAISQAKKAYEKNKPRTSENVSKPKANNENKFSNNYVLALESGGGMDMLLTAANSLNFEENLAENQIE
ncbi:PHD finger protein EHD3 isoform X2 [Cicer arietinum]|uniref:PHD finger protein EHD3 isoform X2 n=1 Tax=Cicer arietinum TaxID=3827 RepID=A0A1S2YBW6_CICAR|nr:PHD finger protein EHD3 isoform X2 [Cicer arietinum]